MSDAWWLYADPFAQLHQIMLLDLHLQFSISAHDIVLQHNPRPQSYGCTVSHYSYQTNVRNDSIDSSH